MQAAPSTAVARHFGKAAGMGRSRQAVALRRPQAASHAGTTTGISRFAAAHACVGCQWWAQREPSYRCQQRPIRSSSDAAKAEAPSRQVDMQLPVYMEEPFQCACQELVLSGIFFEFAPGHLPAMCLAGLT